MAGRWANYSRDPGLSIPDSQRDTAALLARLAGRAPIETHISAVFVGADTVWKLRKAVRLDFLDFSTLAERHRTAERELALNQAQAPGLYRDVVAVTQDADGRLALGGEGATIDWVVRMAPLPGENFLDAIAARDGISPALADALGDAVAAYHAALPQVARDQAAASHDVARGNARSALAAGLDPAAVARWETDCLAALAARADWLAARAAGGFVRRAHGDLHLGNMAMWHGHPVAFDALEFDEDLATIDLGYDLAFLLMDLDVRVGRLAANRVMNRYVARTGDWDSVRGLPVFLSLRAMVRAHVQARGGNQEAAAIYLARAQSYLAAAIPRVVAIGGLPGTGKSTLARAVAPDLGPAPGALILRSDEIRKRLYLVAPEVRLPASAYGRTVSHQVATALIAGVAGVAAHGHTVIADATFLDLRQRAAVAEAAGAAPFTGLWLQAPMAVLEARIAARHGDASDADIAVLRQAASADRIGDWRGPGDWRDPSDWRDIDATDLDRALVLVRNALTPR